eukprot:4328952-Alexandrium_andersonii.AAC.1
MSASLVGSEMCIRDRCMGAPRRPRRRQSPAWHGGQPSRASWNGHLERATFASSSGTLGRKRLGGEL